MSFLSFVHTFIFAFIHVLDMHKHLFVGVAVYNP